jgi:hypothetical protein
VKVDHELRYGKTMNRNQQKTVALVRQHIIDSLERVAGDDENLDHMQYVCEGVKHPIDASACEVDSLLNDPKVKAAFKKFVRQTIGGYQYMEDEFGNGESRD